MSKKMMPDRIGWQVAVAFLSSIPMDGEASSVSYMPSETWHNIISCNTIVSQEHNALEVCARTTSHELILNTLY